MLARVVVENGVKKIVPLTADCGSGNPVGTVIAVYSNKVPNGYLPCNGVQFDTAQFPVLYALLGDDHTPDLRECTLVGIGRSDRTMGNHDEYTIGQFKDDQSQKITGRYNATGAFGSLEGAFVQTAPFEYANGVARSGTQWSSINFDSSNIVRTGTTTHGKQVGVNFCIKATSGINENQADNVLSALSPVDVVALNNVHSVTSNAVAQALSETRTFTVSLVGWANDADNTPYTIRSVNATGYKIADKTYVIPVEIYPQDSDPAPSTVIHLVSIADIERILLVGGVFTRAPSYGIGCKPQISGTGYYLRRVDNDNNWLPNHWGTGTNTLIQGSVIVRIN